MAAEGAGGGEQAGGGGISTSRKVNTTAPLTGGGALSSDLTLAIPAATDSVAGYLTAADHATLTTAAAQAAAAVPNTRSVGTTAPLTGGGALSGNLTLAIPAATDSVDGYLSHTDHASYTTAVAQAAAAVPNTRSVGTTAPLTGGGALSGNLTLAIPAATDSVDGYLAHADHVKITNAVQTARQILTSAPLSGGGDLSADRTLALLLGPAFAVVGGVLAPNAQVIVQQSAANSVTFNGLAGDTDGGYDLDCYIVQPGATNPVYTIQPNGITANQGGQRTTVDTALTATQRSDLCLTFVSTTATSVRARTSFNSKSGVVRKFIGFAAWKASNENFESNFSEWTDTATVITSLKINCSVALGIGAGSVFVLTPLGRSNW
jgi:hypothetical protein